MAKGNDTRNHPGRKVHREAFQHDTPGFAQLPQLAEDSGVPAFEAAWAASPKSAEVEEAKRSGKPYY